MARKKIIPRPLIILCLIVGLVLLVNGWLTGKIKQAEREQMASAAAAQKIAKASPRAQVPVIEPSSDLLAPVQQASSQRYPRRVQPSPDRLDAGKDYEFPEDKAFLPQ